MLISVPESVYQLPACEALRILDMSWAGSPVAWAPSLVGVVSPPDTNNNNKERVSSVGSPSLSLSILRMPQNLSLSKKQQIFKNQCSPHSLSHSPNSQFMNKVSLN